MRPTSKAPTPGLECFIEPSRGTGFFLQFERPGRPSASCVRVRTQTRPRFRATGFFSINTYTLDCRNLSQRRASLGQPAGTSGPLFNDTYRIASMAVCDPIGLSDETPALPTRRRVRHPATNLHPTATAPAVRCGRPMPLLPHIDMPQRKGPPRACEHGRPLKMTRGLRLRFVTVTVTSS